MESIWPLNDSGKHACNQCGFDLWIPIWQSEVALLGFYNDDRFPGRLIFALNEHFDHPDEVPDDIYAQFSLESRMIGGLLRSLFGAERINYCTLGNTLPHVHTHIIPRYSNDPIPTRPIWEHPARAGKLDKDRVEQMSDILRKELAKVSDK